jgi:predicted O-methyltransferase YrrM
MQLEEKIFVWIFEDKLLDLSSGVLLIRRGKNETVPALQTKFGLANPSKPLNIQSFAGISAYQFAASLNKIVIISAEFKLDYSAIGHFDSSY